MVSAFGGTEFPTSTGYDAQTVGEALADFVIDNNLDGVDIDWCVCMCLHLLNAEGCGREDSSAFSQGTGEVCAFHASMYTVQQYHWAPRLG
jgi:hypothetical protein